MPTFKDSEFGEIVVRRSPQARYIKVRVAPSGGLRVSAPRYTPLFAIKQFIRQSKGEIRELVENTSPNLELIPNMPIGKSHKLIIRHESNQTKINYKKPSINLYLNEKDNLNDPKVQALVKPAIIKALRTEAKAYLPRRVEHIAKTFGFGYEHLRFSHAAGRWGSCSSNNTISLNIALMRLPFELIDYVIIHELCHTKEMNHSRRFWQLVGMCDPDYKVHRKNLKEAQPHI